MALAIASSAFESAHAREKGSSDCGRVGGVSGWVARRAGTRERASECLGECACPALRFGRCFSPFFSVRASACVRVGSYLFVGMFVLFPLCCFSFFLLLLLPSFYLLHSFLSIASFAYESCCVRVSAPLPSPPHSPLVTPNRDTFAYACMSTSLRVYLCVCV